MELEHKRFMVKLCQLLEKDGVDLMEDLPYSEHMDKLRARIAERFGVIYEPQQIWAALREDLEQGRVRPMAAGGYMTDKGFYESLTEAVQGVME